VGVGLTVTLAVNATVAVLDVALAIYPADTVGVVLTPVLVRVIVFVPVVIVALDPLRLEGPVALPLATSLLA
jgi:hypothetical protein